MPRLAVVADANAYIGLSDGGLDQLMLRERSTGVVAWASYFVVDELIGRSARADEREAHRGTFALRRLARHCAMYDGSYQRVNFLADPRDQLCEYLFATPRRKEQRAVDTYGTVVLHAASDPHQRTWPTWVRDFAVGMKQHLEDSEQEFTRGIWEHIVLPICPDASTWAEVRRNAAVADNLAMGIRSDLGFDLCARLIVEELAERAGIAVTPGLLERAVDVLKSSFPLPMRVFNALLARVAAGGVDASRKEVRNTIWDMQLCMSLPGSSAVTKIPVWLITNDELIHAAAVESEAQHLVRRLPEYLSLARNSASWRREIDRF